jgi:ABC-type sugar transport system substrate-binding protein
VPKTVLVLLVGSADTTEADAYQVLQGESAISEAKSAGVAAEIVFASGFDQLRVIRKRMSDTAAPSLDAVIVEPGSVAATGLILKELKGRAGLVLLNAWSPEVDEYARTWGAGLPFGTLSTDHAELGKIQGRQANSILGERGQLLAVTGPQRSSAAVERLEGLRATLRADVTFYEALSGGWTEQDGASAFESWYGLYKTRTFRVDVIAAQSDELAVGAQAAAEAVANPAHREIFRKARVLGVDACPGYGRKLVDAGRLTASVTTPANTGEAIRALKKFWDSGRPLPLKAFTKPTPYPPTAAR